MLRLALFACLIAGHAYAQTINGESTYEDTYAHSPPDGGAKMPTVRADEPKDDSAQLKGNAYPQDRANAERSGRN